MSNTTDYSMFSVPPEIMFSVFGVGVVLNLALFVKFKEEDLRKHPANFFVIVICILNILLSSIPYVMDTEMVRKKISEPRHSLNFRFWSSF